MGERHQIEKLDFDPYEILELTEDKSTETDIKSAYRNKALKWHPDKNPNNRDEAQKKFLQIAKASEILLDASAKAALDRVRHAKRKRTEKTHKMDAKRRKLREDLEAREQQTYSAKEEERMASEKLAEAVERLRQHGSDLLKNIREEVEREVHKQRPPAPRFSASGGSPSSTASATSTSTLASERDFENFELSILTRMRQAEEERKRLAEQISKKDNEGGEKNSN